MMSPTMCPKIKTCHSFLHDITEMKITGCFGRPDAGQGKCRADIFFQSVQPLHWLHRCSYMSSKPLAEAFQVFINAWWVLSNGSDAAQSSYLCPQIFQGQEAQMRSNCRCTRWLKKTKKKKTWRRRPLPLPLHLQKGLHTDCGIHVMLKALMDWFVYVKASRNFQLTAWRHFKFHLLL